MRKAGRQAVSKVLSRLPWNSFGDGPVALFGHPYYLARSALRNEMRRVCKGVPRGALLDVGCGTMPYRDLFQGNQPYECLEIDQPRNRGKEHVTHFYDGHGFPLADQQYGVVLCSQTLEHSFWPEEMLSEVFRVLLPGGQLILAVPFFWPEHEQPFDSQRFTSFGLASRLESVGFSVVGVTKTNPGLSALTQLLIETTERPLRGLRFVDRSTSSGNIVVQILRFILAFPYTVLNIFGLVLRVMPRKTDNFELYLDLVVVAEKPDVSC